MLSNDEIRARYFEKGTRIDRHGNYVEEYKDQIEGRVGFCLLLHYHLINGMSDKKALERLKEYDLSPLETTFLMKRTKAFINDVLGIDLDQVRSSATSTDSYLYQEVNELYPKLNAKYETDRFSPIEFRGYRFQVDEEARQNIQGYIASGVDPSYWVTENNETLEPWTVEDLKELYVLVMKRDADLHQLMSGLKQKIRMLAETKDFTAIKQLAIDYGIV